MRLPELDSERALLAPTTPARTSLLLEQGKARPYRNKPGAFCSILTCTVQPGNPPLVTGIDPTVTLEGRSVAALTGTADIPGASRSNGSVLSRGLAPENPDQALWSGPARTGGTLNEPVPHRSIATGKRPTQNAKVADP
ncbi:MAG: hypothetical protein WBJ06_06950 [Candidatus Methanoculleus thermohydrogenotrophicum]|jgi:hypothetical protein|nr:hypothetical protein [Candidatus Methanoculleus thermohydrogenotrophicum]